jgi:parallel beta-helix repeat protein
MNRCSGPLNALVVAVCIAVPAHAKRVDVRSAAELSSAISAAQAGDEIVLADGVYSAKGFTCSAHGTKSAPIRVRAANPGQASMRFTGAEGFRVTGPHWQFSHLIIEGACAPSSGCEHAFHVTGDARGFVLADSQVIDFNAQLKVNAEPRAGAPHAIPHGGLIERNEIFDRAPRPTSSPVTKLNIDTGDDWIVRDNYLHDFQKGAGDQVSYAAFMKSGGQRGVFERNLVICSSLHTGGTRLGLSFGGGGTAPEYCSPGFASNVPCDVEHRGGALRNNVIVNCSDVGIYLNRAAETLVSHNTLIATQGIDFRFATTSGTARANVLTGAIRERDGGQFADENNRTGVTLASFEAWYREPLTGDMRVDGSPGSLSDGSTAEIADDACGLTRGSPPFDIGAIEHAQGGCKLWPKTASAAGGSPGTGGAGNEGARAGTSASGGAGAAPNSGGPGEDANLAGATGNNEGGAGSLASRAPGAAQGTSKGSGCAIARAPERWSAWLVSLAFCLGLARRTRARVARSCGCP